jgi:alpha-amylase
LFPVVYQGQEQHLSGAYNPLNREAVWLSDYNTSSPLYTYTTFLNTFRNNVINASSDYLTYFNHVVYNDSNTLAMRKGYDGRQVITVLNNDGENGVSRGLSLSNEQTGYNASMVVTDIVSCTNTTVDGNGTFEVVIANGLPKVFYPATLVDSTSCLRMTTTTTTLPSASSTATSKPKKSGAMKVADWSGLTAMVICLWAMVGIMIGLTR